MIISKKGGRFSFFADFPPQLRQFAARMVDSARAVLNDFLPDVWVYTDHSKVGFLGGWIENMFCGVRMLMGMLMRMLMRMLMLMRKGGGSFYVLLWFGVFLWVWKWGVSPALEASLLLTGRSLWQFPGLRWAWCWWRWRVDWCCIVNLYILRLGGWVGNMWCFDVQLDGWESMYFFLFWTHESNFYLVGDWFFRNLFGGRNHCQKPQVRFPAAWFVVASNVGIQTIEKTKQVNVTK